MHAAGTGVPVARCHVQGPRQGLRVLGRVVSVPVQHHEANQGSTRHDARRVAFPNSNTPAQGPRRPRQTPRQRIKEPILPDAAGEVLSG